jgi:diguanylate cyclase (GGDEF)-like protein
MQETESNRTSLPNATLRHFIFQGVVALGLMLMAAMSSEKVAIYMVVVTGSMICVAATQFFNEKATVNFFLFLLIACYCYFHSTDFNALSFIWCLCVTPTIIGLGNLKKAVFLSFILIFINLVMLEEAILESTSTTLVLSDPQVRFISTILLIASLLLTYHWWPKANPKTAELKLSSAIESEDSLTGLYQRRYMESYIDVALSALNQTSAGLSVIIVDIDNFRAINERYGHSSGNIALRSIGQLIVDSLDQDYVVGRWDGNAFIIVLPYDDNQAALLIGELLRKKIDDLALNFKGDRIYLSCTLGISSSSKLDNAQKLLLDAENKLYRGKKFGGNIIILS